MGDEYDPDAFAVRVSQNLFRVLAGRASEPMPIVARNSREAQLIKAVRREEQKRVAEMERELHVARVRESIDREYQEEKAFVAATKQLRARYQDASLTLAPSEHRPCAAERTATVECYRQHGVSDPIRCAGHVDKFAACARQLLQ